MLEKLYIQNYAIIDEIAIVFSDKLNIITGETGAGKSILMGALSLILGERADTSVLMSADKKCFIEGFFNISHKQEVKAFLAANELDHDDELVVRRDIAANGKSRAFINDTPATLQQLKELAGLLVDLHQQFDTLELGDAGFQREVLDALSGNQDKLDAYHLVYTEWHQTKKALEALQLQKSNFNKELDYFQFLYDELKEAAFTPNELEDLDAELQMLSNAELIKTSLTKAVYDLKESEQPIVQTLKQMVIQLHHFAGMHKDIAAIAERLQSAQIEIADIASDIENMNDDVHFDEKRIELINDRLSIGYKMFKKHGVATTDELLTIQAGLQEKLQAVLHIDEAIIAREAMVKELMQKAGDLADAISAARQAQATPLVNEVNNLLQQVGMPNARLKVEIKSTSLQPYGKDAIEFLFDANKSNRFEPLRKVASGGELSRLMLCIKSLVAKSIDLPTLIFDEIDTGISGEAARQVGIILKELANSRQVICITHQPQIAGKANTHFFVYKEIKGDQVKTNIRILTQDERINAIAQMLSGERPTAAALENAREMIMN
ncbi:DNA repair protein RecN [Limnovirga soli]|uniref:DNA repair protein RecN n=1 Tax=Limnovirga soli TaxID=2656915 RepID=A0A8J8JWD2_9BACT|nr:DNA repair protein RecN [Limnovirga soli]NNV55176.1 DNA repair protein RecN [Limnovirga soli]